jgi:5-methylcytosine-specific restriction endonuclease McrA
MDLKSKILEFRRKGYTYNQIVAELGCSKSTVAYHCNSTTKKKIVSRNKINRKSATGIIGRKIESFFHSRSSSPAYKLKREKRNQNKHSPQQRKVQMYKSRANDGIRRNRCKNNFGVKEFIEKVGETPKCYLTGRQLDLSKKAEYQLDHIHPVSKGGSNELGNLGVTCKEANMAKGDMTTGEFIDLCIEVLSHHGYKIN